MKQQETMLNTLIRKTFLLKMNKERAEHYKVLKNYNSFLILIKTKIIREYHKKKETIYSLYPKTNIKLIVKS